MPQVWPPIQVMDEMWGESQLLAGFVIFLLPPFPLSQSPLFQSGVSRANNQEKTPSQLLPAGTEGGGREGRSGVTKYKEPFTYLPFPSAMQRERCLSLKSFPPLQSTSRTKFCWFRNCLYFKYTWGTFFASWGRGLF